MAQLESRQFLELIELGDLLLDVSSYDCNKEKYETKLSLAQGRILYVLYRMNTAGARVKELAEEVHLTPGAISQQVDHLVKTGLVTREASESDRRAVTIKLSPEGANAFHLHKARLQKHVQAVLADIPSGDKDIFFQVLSKAYASALQLKQEFFSKKKQNKGDNK